MSKILHVHTHATIKLMSATMVGIALLTGGVCVQQLSFAHADTTSETAETPRAGADFSYVPDFSSWKYKPATRYTTSFNLEKVELPHEMFYFIFKESGGNYDHGFSSGDSFNALGAFQIDRRFGLADFFKMVYNYDPSTFYMMRAVGEKYNWDFKTPLVWDADATSHPVYKKFTEFGRDLNAAWHEAYKADPHTFKSLQDYYIYRNYYLGSSGIKRTMLYYGVDLSARSNQLKSLVWGMTNLFGKGGGVDQLKRGNVWGVNRFLKLADINGNMSDAELVERICDAVINNIKELYPSSQIYWQGWINRYESEKKYYLSKLTLPAGEVHRVYDPRTGEHLFITSQSDKIWYVSRGWNDEGRAWIAPVQSAQVVYRMVNPYSGDHMFTVDTKEVETMVSNGWQVQYKPFYSADATKIPVYRLFNPYESFATHHFTMDKAEVDHLVSLGWKNEGIGWYAESK